MKNKILLVSMTFVMFFMSANAQCFQYTNMLDIFTKTPTEVNTFLLGNSWKEGKPSASNNFGRSIRSWSLNNAMGALCWIDVCYKANAKNIIVYQFISDTNYKEIKDLMMMNGFTQQKMKVSANDMYYAFVKEDKCFILRKHTYDHETSGNFAIILLPSDELTKVWELYAK